MQSTFTALVNICFLTLRVTFCRLYQLLEERDVVLSIIKKALRDEPASDLVKAVEAESSSNWSGATASYREFMDGIQDVGNVPPEFDFSLESYFKVLLLF